MNIKKMILSGGMLVFVAAVVAGGTGAFFSDTETSTGNVFTAGSVSVELMTVGHEYYGDDNNAPMFEWFNGQSRFDLEDLKPLDTGNLDIDLENGANEAHICAMITGDQADLTDDEDIALYDQLNFWVDGTGEQVVPGQWFDLGVTAPNSTTGTGVEYCFGDSNADETGLVSCDYGDGSIDYNAAQDGSFSADMMFFAIQTRNNEDFSCDQLTPEGEYNPDTEPSVPSSEPVVFTLDESSPGIDQNEEGETADNAVDGQPYFTYNLVDGGVEVTFENPSAYPFVFDYQVDDEAGTDRNLDSDNNINTDLTISEGPLSGEEFGPTYNRVELNGGESQTVTITGNNEISIGLREGAEQNWYIDWVNFVAVN